MVMFAGGTPWPRPRCMAECVEGKQALGQQVYYQPE